MAKQGWPKMFSEKKVPSLFPAVRTVSLTSWFTITGKVMEFQKQIFQALKSHGILKVKSFKVLEKSWNYVVFNEINC